MSAHYMLVSLCIAINAITAAITAARIALAASEAIDGTDIRGAFSTAVAERSVAIH
jgi:hypothetical protein